MSIPHRDLPDGLYEHVVTESLVRELARLPAERNQELGALDKADAHVRLARYVASEVERVLSGVPEKQRPLAQVEIVNRVLDMLREIDPDASPDDARVAAPGAELHSVYRMAPPQRPLTPLSISTLLTRNREGRNLGMQLAREIASADRIDVLMAFITVSGVRALRTELEAFARRGQGPCLRVLTTVFTGTTDAEAVEMLANLPGATVKVSYDTRRTRLHAKAWLFERNTGLHSAYIGSANLTSTALGSGQEWMVKACAADLPHVVEQFRGTFESLWNDSEFEEFDATSEASKARLRQGLRGQTESTGAVLQFYQLRPFPFQEEILDRLEAERTVHGRRRNLVVAATGTGKTVVAAFDYQRQVARTGTAPRLLFVAHRKELLEQALAVFRQVLRDGAFGELLVGGEEPASWEHVFATIQSAASRGLLAKLGAEYFRYVVVDECHHAPADSYRSLVPHLKPDILLGLTATPERADGKSLLADFDNHIAAELRLWDALDRQLLVPFEYYGIADTVDLDQVRWTRTGYETQALSQIYTGNEKRVDLIVAQLQRRVADLRQVRALAFCVSVEHAQFMAQAFTRRGLPAVAIHGDSEDGERAAAPRRLRDRDVNVLCTCDLYNEGVDLPSVDTLLFLRPTQSATLFLQQLGRGLRHDEKKTSCLVLDFIGRQRAEFRFDNTLSALTRIPRSRLTKAVEEGFPYLPSGCVLQLDAVSRTYVVNSLKEHLRKRSRMVDELRELSAEDGKPPTLAQFLEATSRDLEDVYSNKSGWTTLRREAGIVPANDPANDDVSRRLGWLVHTDDTARLDVWRRAASGAPAVGTDADRRRFAMLAFQLENRGIIKTAEEVSHYLGSTAPIREEINQLADVLSERIVAPRETYPVDEWPLALHCHYERREIVAAVGHAAPGAKGRTPQGGILKDDDEQRELLFITLDKSDTSFSPTTRYKDYAISPELFHWETQSIASVTRESGRRYTESPSNGWTFHLFVRTNTDAPYAYIGPATLVSHEGDRPIAITWRLEHRLPAALYDRFATLAQG